MSSRLKRFFAIAAPAGFLVLALAGIIYPFCIIRDTGRQNNQTICCSGRARWWHPNTLPVRITINRTGSNQAPGEATANAVRRAMQSWNDVPSAFFEFSDAGLTDQDTPGNDNINIVVFDVAGTNFPVGTTTLAFSRTFTTDDVLGYRAIDSDMVYNARDYQWTAGGGNQSSFDIETVALHEFGHHLGLDHAGGPRDISGGSTGCGPVLTSAVMYYAVSQGSIKRNLQPDDVAGISQIYPEWQVEGYVFDTNGQPAVNAEVRFQGTMIPQDTIAVNILRTDQDGYYFGVVVDPQFTVSVPSFGYQYTGEVAVTFSSSETQRVDFQLQPLALSGIRGSVRDAATGQSIAARVELFVAGEVFQTAQTNNGAYEFTDLPATDPVTTNYHHIRVIPELPYPVIETTQELIVRAGQPTVLNFDLAPAEVLLVDQDGASDFERFYTAALDTLHTSYVTWNSSTQGAATAALKLFPAKPVIWWTGNSSNNFLLQAERDSLRAHLQRGGSLFLTGQNVAEHLAQSDSVFLREVLRARWGGNNRDPIAHGVHDDPVGGGARNIALGGGDGARNQTSQDLLLPQTGAEVCVVYDTTRNNAAAVRIREAVAGVPRARIVFFGFGWEGINSLPPGFATRERILSDILNWLTNTSSAVAAREEESGLADRFQLWPNYPNPFNGNTEIAFYIPARAANRNVNVKIFDTLGREVRTLVDQPLPAGEHRVRWDGRDQAGLPMTTGLYLYKMAAEEFLAVRKLLYLK